jgi:MFS family permease
MRNLLPWKNFNELFISIVYFVQGSAGLVGIASALILREQLGLDFYQMGLIGIASIIPWSIKPLYGILTDLVPIGGYRRKPYLHIGPLMAIAGYLGIFLFGTSFEAFFLALVVGNLGLALTDVATDGFVVEQSNEENAARLQGITQASIRVSSFITSFFSGLLVFKEILTPHQMYLALAFFPLLTFGASFFIKEAKDENIAKKLLGYVKQKQTESTDLQIFTKTSIITLILIFVGIIGYTAFSGPINEWVANYTAIPGNYLFNPILWGAFFLWMIMYFLRLKKFGLTTTMIFIALGFILLWRFNPGVGSPFFFYTRDILEINEQTLGFISTTAQVGSIIGVLLAVMLFDRFKLKTLLLWTVILGAVAGLTSFAVTNPEWGRWLGDTTIIKYLAYIISSPVYFFQSVFDWMTGSDWQSPITLITSTTNLERFLFVDSIIGELIFMIAYIPLLKLAVLITPKKAEATNFAVIASIMNIGLALSSWASGFLYNTFMTWLHPALDVTAIEVDVIEILIIINIVTSLFCLVLLPFLDTNKALTHR